MRILLFLFVVFVSACKGPEIHFAPLATVEVRDNTASGNRIPVSMVP